ncbi:unnamed protein product [Rhizophagus irregularis]|uniref:Uncharacterized protein n=1 Tax=Rhizophagus irregularis TaxID=588596 RepID=A0A916E6B9_9GLOM|nr:unnamed protein product [Rhizophagus irregularis]CAB5358192.1 unnamed protein product [Rhizophagus irregularis]
MDNKRYEKYFDKNPKEWSLVDFDVLQELSSRRKIKIARELMISKKEDLKTANLLWVTPKESKKINENKIEEEKRTLSLKERKLALRERAAKVRSLELHNIQLENEFGLGSEGGREG